MGSYQCVMTPPIPQSLSPEREAVGRAVIAEFEWKQQQRKCERRMQGWSFALLVGTMLVAAGGAIFVRARNIPITTHDICGWLAIAAGSAAAVQYQTHRELRKLRAEVEELKQALRETVGKRNSDARSNTP